MSLWEEQEKASDNNVSPTALVPITKPQDWVIQDYQYERALEMDYVPNLDDERKSAFWKLKVIPAITRSLTQDVKARNTLIHAMASVRDLATTIQQAASIVKSTHGSQKAIEIAQTKIPEALKVLEEAIDTAKSLENSSVALFEEHAKEFLEIIGPKGADFAKQKEEIETQILLLEKRKEEVIDELASHKGKLEKYNNLVHVAQARVSGSDDALKETRIRYQKMQKLNEEAENSVKAIPDTVTQTTTTEYSPYYRRWWWWWGESRTRTTT
ncbi:unnamed protein product, partial [Didymodactylos carnosus]